jgi:ATP-dependent helicase/DNAse subunit B
MGRTVEDFNPIDIGTVYHDVLNDYYNSYKESLIKDKDGFLVEDTIEYLREITLKYAMISGYKSEIKKDLLIIENIYLRLFNFIKEDIERLKDSPDNIIPWGFEIEFGSENPFEIDINNMKIPLRGKIDRIDKVMDNDNYIVIDYKSSAYGKKDLSHIEKGLSLQLPVYIMSQNDKNVVAGSYSTLSDGEYFTAMGILGGASNITKRQKGSMDKVKWDEVLTKTKEKIFNMVESIKNGDFSVNPLECSPYCSYKDICRYEKVMEVEEQ